MDEVKITLDLSRLEPKLSTDIKPDMCKCQTCGNKYKISECIPDTGHHDGWEYPSYTIHLCPKCEDGGDVNDYFLSDELTKLWEDMCDKEERLRSQQ